MIDSELREAREKTVRDHMEGENVHDYDAVIDIFEGTKIVCERVYFDSATISRQLTE